MVNHLLNAFETYIKSKGITRDANWQTLNQQVGALLMAAEIKEEVSSTIKHTTLDGIPALVYNPISNCDDECKKLEEETGYNFKPDFDRAELLWGLDGIRETYEMAVAGYRDECVPDAAALATLEVSLNWKAWELSEGNKRQLEMARLYHKLWQELRQWNANYAITHPEFSKIWLSIAYS